MQLTSLNVRKMILLDEIPKVVEASAVMHFDMLLSDHMFILY
jgi:hypothetical protein